MSKNSQASLLKPLKVSMSSIPLYVYQIPVEHTIPESVFQQAWFNIAKTNHEISFVCSELLETPIPELKKEGPWASIMICDTLEFHLTGIMASFTVPLAEAKISIFALSTFNTDYILVPWDKKELALSKLIEAGVAVPSKH